MFTWYLEHTGDVFVHVENAHCLCLGRLGGINIADLDLGEVDRGRGAPGIQVADNCCCHLDTDGALGLLGGAADVWCEDHVGAVLQLSLEAGPIALGLLGEHVHACAREVAALESVCKCFNVNLQKKKKMKGKKRKKKGGYIKKITR